METWANTLFYLVFLGQILLISYYFPHKIYTRMKTVFHTYPPSQYPKLYPRPVQYYQFGHWLFKMINHGILVLGFIIMLLMLFVIDHSTFADDGYISEFWPALYGMIQFIPLMLLELSECSQHKQMRQANSAPTRKATLQPRRLFNFLSSKALGLAVLLYFGAIWLDLYAHHYVWEWGDTGHRSLVLTMTNLFIIAVGAWNLYGRKQNPHQSFNDRAQQIKTHLRSLLYCSMAMSIFFMIQAADEIFDLEFLGAIMLSLYFQVIVFFSIGHTIRSIQLENVNFEVYRNDSATT